MNDKWEALLETRHIKPTAMRVLVLREMMNFRYAFSLANLETALDTVDKSTLSRIIRLFHDHLLIHNIDDGSGSMKYSVCNNDCDCFIEDQHMHFYCLHCNKTFCLDNVAIPPLPLPSHLTPVSINLVIKGYCESCKRYIS